MITFASTCLGMFKIRGRRELRMKILSALVLRKAASIRIERGGFQRLRISVARTYQPKVVKRYAGYLRYGEYFDTIVLDAHGEDVSGFYQDSRYTVLILAADSCSACVFQLEGYEQLSTLYSGDQTRFVLLWENAIHEAARQIELTNYSLGGRTLLSSRYPTYAVLAQDGEIVLTTDNQNVLQGWLNDHIGAPTQNKVLQMLFELCKKKNPEAVADGQAWILLSSTTCSSCVDEKERLKEQPEWLERIFVLERGGAEGAMTIVDDGFFSNNIAIPGRPYYWIVDENGELQTGRMDILPQN